MSNMKSFADLNKDKPEKKNNNNYVGGTKR